MRRKTLIRPRRRRRPSRRTGIAFQMLLFFGGFWLIAFGLSVGWYLQKVHTNKGKRSPLEVNSVGLPHRLRGHGDQTMEEEINVPVLTHEEVMKFYQPKNDADAFRSPIIVFTCRRAKYLSQTLDDLLRISDHCGFGCPIIVSEDGRHNEIARVVNDYQQKFGELGIPLLHLHHEQDEKARRQNRGRPAIAYQALAHHYGWGLRQVFHEISRENVSPERVIILEEDLHVSVDFLGYMKATSRLLDEDPNLLAVSAYNDNGHLGQDTHRVLRSDFFPGLGWMMTRKLWVNELEAKWPDSYWDDWLREPDQRLNRQILRPEVSRTYHFGAEGGTSNHQFGAILDRVKLNTDNIDWEKQDLSYLKEDDYNKNYAKMIANARPANEVATAISLLETSDARLEYRSINHFAALADQLDISNDEKASVPRTGYKGVVEARLYGEHLLFLTPPMQQLQVDFPTL